MDIDILHMQHSAGGRDDAVELDLLVDGREIQATLYRTSDWNSEGEYGVWGTPAYHWLSDCDSFDLDQIGEIEAACVKFANRK